MPDENGNLTLDEIRAQAAGEDIDPVVDPPQDPQPADPVDPALADSNPVDPVEPVNPADPVDPVEDPANPGFDIEGKPFVAADPEPEPEPDPAPADKPNPMKEVRDKLNEAKAARELVTNTMNKFATGKYPDVKLADHMLEDGTGIDYDSLNKAMETVDVAERAQGAGLTPEVQEAVERIEKEKEELARARLEVSMDRALNNLQIDLGLKQGDVNNFFKDAMEKDKNPYRWLNQGGTLQDLYNIVYAENLEQSRIDAAVAAAKAEWEAAAAAAGRAPLPNPGNQVPPKPKPGTGMSLAEMRAKAVENK